MSAIDTYSTRMTCGESLCEAIEATTGISTKVFPNSKLKGYFDHQVSDVDILVSKEALLKAKLPFIRGIGFKQNASGAFDTIFDDMDGGRVKDLLKTVTQNYTAIEGKAAWKAAGYTNFEEERVKTERGFRLHVRAQAPVQQTASQFRS